MSKKRLNFDLGSRGLTPAETLVVAKATKLLRSSIERHRKELNVVRLAKVAAVTAKPAAKPSAKPAAKSVSSKAKLNAKPKVYAGGSATWTSNKVAPAIRKY